MQPMSRFATNAALDMFCLAAVMALALVVLW